MSPAPETNASGRTEYGTPPALVAELSRLFGPIDLDVCASKELHVCERYLTNVFGDWPVVDTAFCNPPYGRNIGAILDQCRWAPRWPTAKCCLCLVPNRPDTVWWSEATDGAMVFSLTGRIRFIGESAGAKFPSALVVYGEPVCDEWRLWSEKRDAYQLYLPPSLRR